MEKFKLVLVLLSTAFWCETRAQEAPSPFSEPSIGYLHQFAGASERVFIFERYDAEGKLVARDVKALTEPVVIDGASRRTIGGYAISLRGLVECPQKEVTYNRKQRWACEKAAADYMGAIYNRRASVILCKTLVLRSLRKEPDPSSCFALVGGKNSDPLMVVNDDDAMVFLGLASIGKTDGGASRRPDLLHSQNLSGSDVQP
ncbi:hypothetical protein [Rhizobium sp. 18065]|uniref:hypothetical protein n=1 Tax=Rhizobium sp. 18065 TaxID=2681411 RepID=UPI00135A0904|nr:hypothetical protein [Rhizobium sp. 18065]